MCSSAPWFCEAVAETSLLSQLWAWTAVLKLLWLYDPDRYVIEYAATIETECQSNFTLSALTDVCSVRVKPSAHILIGHGIRAAVQTLGESVAFWHGARHGS